MEVTGMGLGSMFRSIVNLPNKVMGEAGGAIFGRDSWMGKRMIASSKSQGVASDFLSSAGGAIQHAQRNREADKVIAKAGEDAAILAAKKAAHDTEVAQLSQDSLGAVSMRRRRGLYATMLTGVGSNPMPTGKSVLGS